MKEVLSFPAEQAFYVRQTVVVLKVVEDEAVSHRLHSKEDPILMLHSHKLVLVLVNHVKGKNVGGVGVGADVVEAEDADVDADDHEEHELPKAAEDLHSSLHQLQFSVQ